MVDSLPKTRADKSSFIFRPTRLIFDFQGNEKTDKKEQRKRQVSQNKAKTKKRKREMDGRMDGMTKVLSFQASIFMQTSPKRDTKAQNRENCGGVKSCIIW